ncbi:MAG TPA: hypothetical protein VH087_12090 [Thermoanaerobaculia bacterium]|nr:hypothetical protein [Thermoanaerobaculia bacterium]
MPAAAAEPDEPIAFTGHGGFFDSKGNQIPVTTQWVAATQEWYRKRLAAALPQQKKSAFASYQKRLSAEVRGEGQTALVIRQQELDWLLANGAKIDARTTGKLNALKYALEWKLPTQPSLETPKVREKFTLDPAVEQKLRTFAPPKGPIVFLSTINTGQAYLDECTMNQVPIPPSINVIDDVNGTAGWKRLGYIPESSQFIVGTPAQVRVYHSTSPEGMCVALPRYTDETLATVNLDGVICLSQVTSKVCFWDNQMATPPSSGNGIGFNFGATEVIPIGVPSTPGGRYQGGGREIEFGTGDVCTDCHGGENPYIIHPELALPSTPTGSGGPLMSTIGVFGPDDLEFAPNRYDPIVGATWPQNDKSMTPAYVPSQCLGCHTQGDAGRFPHLSTVYSGYCANVLFKAVGSATPHTMPPGAAGSLANDPAVVAFKNWCGQLPSAGPSDRGDPHLTTTNGIPYDFQAAGEFTTLRNSDSRFELQTRQTPITTSFVPGANAYTGLQSCVSLNSAAALRLGKHRVTMQGSVNNERVQLRIDGTSATLPAGGIDLGGGNLITGTSGGGIDVRADDGTHVKITPQHWVQEGYWYLDVDVLNTPAREGTMGTILPGNFLPLAPNGASFGPKPAAISARYDLLNHHFADAWRVTNATSLFDYAAGTSTADFTDRNWPPEPGKECRARIGILKAPQPIPAERARKLCSVIKDKAVFENCVFDTIVMGDEGVVQAYQRTLKARGTTLLPLSALPLISVRQP